MSEKTQLKRTPLYDRHVEAGAKMTPFGGWEMPLHYGSQVAEHRAVRERVGIFDVSHMGQIDVRGPKAAELLQRAIMNDLDRLSNGQALYSPLCREDGGILDDLIVSRLGADHYFVVVNASTQEDDFEHLRQIARRYGLRDHVLLSFESNLWSMIALQGPEAEKTLEVLMPGRGWEKLPYFHALQTSYRSWGGLVSRTGYTGEDGFELIFCPEAGEAIWTKLVKMGVQPCGLGARDTLRLEAGYALSGQDISPARNPIEAGLGWACKESKAWAPVGGRAVALARETAGGRRLVGIELMDGGIPRHNDAILSPAGVESGVVTSGSFSPTLEKGIALAYVDAEFRKPGSEVAARVRGRVISARVTRLPFVKNTSIKSSKTEKTSGSSSDAGEEGKSSSKKTGV